MNASNWKFVCASVIGSTHRNREEPCQDASSVRQVTYGERSYLIGCCSDGAGTAYLAAQGAELACKLMSDQAAEALKQSDGLSSISREHVAQWIQQAASALAELAHDHHAKVRETACTMLLAVLGPQQALFVQIGDGAIVLNPEHGEDYDVVFWPQMGEYAGTTNFLTDSNASSEFVFQWLNRPIHRLAMFTDGLQMLGLDFSSHNAHQPFFDPLFQTLHDEPDVAKLHEPFRDFLASDQIDTRTDDDRTLILATRTHKPEIED